MPEQERLERGGRPTRYSMLAIPAEPSLAHQDRQSDALGRPGSPEREVISFMDGNAVDRHKAWPLVDLVANIAW
jgi:hypothetical protein